MSKYLHLMMALLLAFAYSATWAGKVVANKPPTVSITAPLSGASFSAPGPVTLGATATDTDGTITKVAFYQGTTLIGTSTNTASPYSVTWSNILAGTYSLTAKATDNSGAITTSAVVSITVNAVSNIGISSPANGATVSGDSVTVTGTFVGDAASTTVWLDNGNSSRLAVLNGNTFSATLPLYAGPNTVKISVVRRDNTSDAASMTITGSKYPVVTFLSPTTTTFTAPANITLAVDAFSPTGLISKVNFNNGATLLSSVAAEPYQYQWNNIPKGSYSITAQATDNLGYTASVSMNISVLEPNVPPSVSLTSPANGAVFQAPANLTLTAGASDSDGTISIVEFYQNGNLLGATNAAPYSLAWPNVSVGSYSLTAKATDNSGGTTVSAPANITVSPPNIPPSVSLASPVANATYTAPALVGLSANAADSDGTIAKVEFYQGTTLLGTATSVPYAVNWANVGAGSYSLTAKATDNLGAVTSSAPVAITVNINNAPTVSLTSPAAGTSAYAPAAFTLKADAADSDGTIANVEFYQGASLVGTATNAPYTVNWANVAAGTYALTAKATDNLGGVTISAPVTVTVTAPLLAFTTPAAGAVLASASVLVKGNFQGPLNSGITVNGVVASLSGNNFYANVPVIAGANTLTATLTLPTGQTTTQSIAVTSDGIASALQISVDSLQGIAPFTSNFTLQNTGAVDLTVQINSGSQFVLPAGVTGATSFTLNGVGSVPVTVAATDANGNTTTQSFMLVALDPLQTDQMFKAVWDGMNNALIAGDKATALSCMNEQAKNKYGPVFDVLLPKMAQIVGSYSAVQRSSITGGIGEYAINRTINGVNRIFFLYFLQGDDGVWRIDSM